MLAVAYYVDAMATTKRQRQKEGRRSRVEAARAAAAKRRRARAIRNVVAIGAVALVAVVVVSLVTGDDDQDVEAGAGSTTTTAAGTPVSLPEPEPGATIEGDTPCPPADGSAERTTAFAKAPPNCIDPAKAYTAEIVTSEGPLTVDLAVASAPKTVNNFVVLARYHYFDGLPFHRIVPDFVVQGGSSGEPDYGSGGPGYRLEPELPDQPYEIGSVVMAKNQAGISGSQFFIVAGPEGEALPLEYPTFGKVTEGTDVVETISRYGVDEQPTKVVTIESVRVSEA